ncbi:MAG TPA: COX15/CtaA family protein [Gammaproteobacteria bacterium]|nr:COX15/CtaA family protein [Gammaproteobacteria bacterium]
MVAFRRLALAATALALVVVVLGAWVRLSDAGLGCPDWPGCYGRLTAPESASALESAQAAWPERPPEGDKAHREMLHRYLAAALGLLVLALAVLALRNRREPAQPVVLPLGLLALVILQALLGMWTVTLLLKPVIVVAHLLGGMATLALLSWLYLSTGRAAGTPATAREPLAGAALAGLAVHVVQIALGGWTSANYAALACPDFPACQGEWWPSADFGEGFVLWRGLGVDYEGGVLDHPARVAIHLTHRIGAVITTLVLGAVGLAAALRGGARSLRLAGAALVGLLAAQWLIAVTMLAHGLPLALAAAHNAVAALLLLTLVYLIHRTWRMRSPA